MRSQSSLTIIVLILSFILSGCTAQGDIEMVFPTSAPEQLPDRSADTRALWVWNQETIIDETAREELFAFARSKQINTLFIFAFSLIRDNPEALRQFIDQAGKRRFWVEFVAGEPDWARKVNHYIPRSFVRDSLDFAKTLPENHQFTGLVFDIEFYTENPPDTWPIHEYVDLIQELADRTEGSELTLTLATPFWFDIADLQQTYQGREQFLSDLLIDTADRVVIMDYRDFAAGGDGLIMNVDREMAYAATIGKPIIIGVETQCNLPDPPKVTFCEEGELILDRELAKVEAAYHEQPSWGGIAIHYYDSYRQLIPFACPDDGSFTIVDPPDNYHTTERLITVRGCGGWEDHPVQIYVDTEMPFLQDHSPIPGPDGRWVAEDITLGALTLPYTHTIFAVTNQLEPDGRATEIRSNEIAVIKE